jgi:Flp pilus assembly protein TadG
MTTLTPQAGDRRRQGLFGDERGVVMIQLALASVVIIGFCGLAIDSGVLWVARGQAQNSADAGALAAASVLAFDDMRTPTRAQTGAVAAASANVIWGSAPAVAVTDVTVCSTATSSCPAVVGLPTPQPRTYFAATVSVYSDAAHGNALPTYFAQLFGMNAQEVRAQATAAVAPANTVRCTWPLAIPDWWTDNNTTPGELSPTFVRYQYPGGGVVATPDVYFPPTFSGSSSATGIQVSNVTLSPNVPPAVMTFSQQPSPASPADPWLEIDRAHFVAVQIPGGAFEANLTSCHETPLRIGDLLVPETAATWASIGTAAASLRAQDAGAAWNEGARRVQGSCAGELTCEPHALLSPRLVVLPMFDPDVYDATRGPGSTPQIRIVNFVGFFIDTVAADGIEGYLSLYPGEVDTAYPSVAYQWALLRTAVLTR